MPYAKNSEPNIIPHDPKNTSMPTDAVHSRWALGDR
jgi:hypothetical protein